MGEWGHDEMGVSPDEFASVPCPTYPEIRLALAVPGAVANRLRAFSPEAIHIATEGPLGMTARRYCAKHDIRFTTAYHTQFPDYLAKRTHLPAAWFGGISTGSTVPPNACWWRPRASARNCARMG